MVVLVEVLDVELLGVVVGVLVVELVVVLLVVVDDEVLVDRPGQSGQLSKAWLALMHAESRS
ncbi:MAG: hypothetical protein ACKORC_08530 [Acidimicrobiia bacterium]